MGRRPRIPGALTSGPFTLAERRAAGLTPEHLRGSSWRRLGNELYCWRGWPEEPWALISAFRRTLPSDATFAGATAAWLWGIGTNPTNPLEVILPPNSSLRTRRGLLVRR